MIATIILCAIGIAVVAGSFAHDRGADPDKYKITEVKEGIKSIWMIAIPVVIIYTMLLIRTGFFGRHF